MRTFSFGEMLSNANRARLSHLLSSHAVIVCAFTTMGDRVCLTSWVKG